MLSIWTCVKFCHLVKSYPFTKQSLVFTTLQYKALENIVEKILWKKEKILVTSIFSFSHNVFYPIQNTFIVSSANALNMDWSEILSFGKELKERGELQGK